MSLTREMNARLRALRKGGATVELTRGNHWRVKLPNGEMVICSSTPSDFRALRKFEADIRRAQRGRGYR